MGNPKLRFSEFIPNSWFRFHKPKSPITTAGAGAGDLPLSLSPSRKSYHFTRSLVTPKPSEIDSPKKASRRRIRRKPIALKSNPSETGDPSGFSGEVETGDCVAAPELRPIKTERVKFSDLEKKSIDDPNMKQMSSTKCRERKENGVDREESSMASSVCSFKEQSSRSMRRSSNGSPRIRIRINSPRLATRIQVNTSKVSLSRSPLKKGISSKSLAVVKCSSNPERDFRESMMEMIVENKIKASKDLEELLACYLSLNSQQYHHLIIQAFTHIWFDLNNIYR